MSRRLLGLAFRHIKRSWHAGTLYNSRGLIFPCRYEAAKRYISLCHITRATHCRSADLEGSQEEVATIRETSDESDGVDGDVRTVIEYDVSDPVIEALQLCTTVESVLDVLKSNQANLKKSHLVQAVLVLWHLQTVFVKIQTQLENITDTTEAEYIAKLHAEPLFQQLLEDVVSSAHDFSIDELTCSLLYLSKMNVPTRSPVSQKLTSEIESRFRSDAANASLAALSRTTVAMKQNSDLWCQLYLLNLVPYIEDKLDNAQTADDLKLLTTCFLHCYNLLSLDALKKYRSVVEDFAGRSILTADDGKSIVKMLTFLSLTFWSNENTEIIRVLCGIIKGHIHKLDVKEIISLHKVFQTHQEPAFLAEETFVAARNYIDTNKLVYDKDINVGMLSAVAPLSTYSEKLNLAKLLYRELDSDYFLNTMMNMFQILRSLKTSDRKLCHLFWRKTTEALVKNSVEREPLKLLRVAHRYMYFNNNMGGTYRNFTFEKTVISWILDELEHGLSSFVPSRLARCASFVIAYSQDPHVVAAVIQRLLSVRDQLSKVDCVALSRGVEIMLELSKNRAIHPDVMEKLVELDTCMNESAWRHLTTENLSLSSISTVLRTFFNRRASSDSLLFHTIVQKLDNCESNLNSRLIRDISHCMAGLNFLQPRMIDEMAAYIVRHENDVMSETAERVLSTAYYFGYQPQDGARFFSVCSRLLIKEKNRLPCLSILQTCLSLSYFHAFPQELVSDVFAVDFLERIDSELSTCYSRATYPVKVRYTLMELNRAVCLDQPELDVPWFHAKFCEEISSLDPGISTAFHEDVNDHLITLLGHEDLVQTAVYSPYGYKINFLVLLDSMTRPLRRSQISDAKEKVAIILHSEGQYTIGERLLKGQQQMRQRHLEMLGYRVVPIPQFVWNAMYLTEPHAKKMFLSDQIWPER